MAVKCKNVQMLDKCINGSGIFLFNEILNSSVYILVIKNN